MTSPHPLPIGATVFVRTDADDVFAVGTIEAIEDNGYMSHIPTRTTADGVRRKRCPISEPWIPR